MRLLISLALASLLALVPALARADSSSLYSGRGPRPGPDVLYQPPATGAQLTNSGIWQAPSTLVSGTSAYRSGEFLYQDFLYDDHGANGGQRDQNDPRTGSHAGTSGDIFSQPNGTYTYPTNPVYAENAADLVEFRVKPLVGSTAFRITLNTLRDPALVGTSIAIGNGTGVPVAFPYNAHASAPADTFLTLHGTSADLRDAITKAVIATYPVTVDMMRRQLEVRVPHGDWDPTGKVVRFAAGVGLWDQAANTFLIPQQNADATHPGGAGSLGAAAPAFFNVAFRRECGGGTGGNCEEFPNIGDPSGTLGNPAWWRDKTQGNALKAAGDLSQLYASVDFNKLAAAATDDSAIPKSGAMNRILSSHNETEQGVDYSTFCANPNSCPGELRGNLQPYAIYIPPRQPPASGFGMTLLLHSLSANYNQYLGSKNQSQFGDRSSGSIVITPAGRGPDGWYYDAAGADTFEVWADVAARYRLDPAYTAIAGYSMGGYGTYKLATQYPDLFAKGQPTVGPPGLGVWIPPSDPNPGGASSLTTRMLESLRNVPFLMWVEKTDELVPFAGTEAHARRFDALGYRYIFDAFAPGDHLGLAVNDEYGPAAGFLGDTKVDRDPAHVSYVVNPKMDFPAVGTVADHAYWLSRLALRDGGGSAPLANVDVRSEGFGTGDPAPSGTQAGGGALTGGHVPAIAYSEQSQTFGPTPATRAADVLDINARNLRSVTIDPVRARVDCEAVLNVVSDGPVTVNLAGCNRSQRFGAGSTRACSAGGPPRSSVARRGLQASGRGLRLSGRAIGYRCGRRHSVPARVRRVSVTLARRAGRRCRFVDARGHLTAARSCARPVRLRARLGRQLRRSGKVKWSLGLRGRLPAGRYVLDIRATDSIGRVERLRGRPNHKSFRVR